MIASAGRKMMQWAEVETTFAGESLSNIKRQRVSVERPVDGRAAAIITQREGGTFEVDFAAE